MDEGERGGDWVDKACVVGGAWDEKENWENRMNAGHITRRGPERLACTGRKGAAPIKGASVRGMQSGRRELKVQQSMSDPISATF